MLVRVRGGGGVDSRSLAHDSISFAPACSFSLRLFRPEPGDSGQHDHADPNPDGDDREEDDRRPRSPRYPVPLEPIDHRGGHRGDDRGRDNRHDDRVRQGQEPDRPDKRRGHPDQQPRREAEVPQPPRSREDAAPARLARSRRVPRRRQPPHAQVAVAAPGGSRASASRVQRPSGIRPAFGPPRRRRRRSPRSCRGDRGGAR